jgi:4-hydroxy-tetrahydrodipicolinate reductase
VAEPIKVLVSGAAGRMGETVCAAVEGAEDMELAGRADPALDTSVADLLEGANVMVDFTTPEAAPANVMEAIDAGVHAVVGSTGFDLDDLREKVTGAEGEANCFLAPNFAIGAVLMMEASKLVAPHMPEAEIVELHHDQKKDAPSGTAKRTAELVGEAGGNVHEPIHSVRLPGLVAHQEVVFGGPGQTLTIRHDSTDRTSFMPGVLLAVHRVPDLPERFVVGLENLLNERRGDDER